MMQPQPRLREGLKILVVDDEPVLRKIFARSILRIAPSWEISEASSGEAALERVDTDTFDIILLDQYMVSTTKAMTGTETILALRAKGVRSSIIGTSANDVSASHLEAGADLFVHKPVPTDKAQLAALLHRASPLLPLRVKVVGKSPEERVAALGALKAAVPIEAAQELESPAALLACPDLAEAGLVLVIEAGPEQNLADLANALLNQGGFLGLLAVLARDSSSDVTGYQLRWVAKMPTAMLLRREIRDAYFERHSR